MIRVFRHYIPLSLFFLAALEGLLMFGSVYLGLNSNLLGFNPAPHLLVGPVWPKALWYAGVMILFLSATGLYQRGLRAETRDVLLRVTVSFITGALFIVAILSIFPVYSIGDVALPVALASSFIGVVLIRALALKYTDQHFFKRRVLVVGAGNQAGQIQELRRKTDWFDTQLVGYVHIPGQATSVDKGKVHYLKGRLLEYAREQRVDQLVVAIREQSANFPLEQILDCKMAGIEVIDLMSFFEQRTGKIKINSLNPSSIIFADGFIQAMFKTYAHRSFDIIVSIVMLVLTSPVIVLTMLAIVVESGLPIFYRQTRVGRDNRQFKILKFRSMGVDAERSGVQWAVTNDARVTRVGKIIRKLRIDEIPQLINVLRGEMSFVGPRPERPEFVARLEAKIPYYRVRHRVNPGITGWAQICYPYGGTERDALEKLQFDLYYIKNYSLFLDVMIMIQTAQVILWGKGAR